MGISETIGIIASVGAIIILIITIPYFIYIGNKFVNLLNKLVEERENDTK